MGKPPLTPPPPPTPPAQPPKESLARGYKFVWRILLISNLALGAYIFTRPRKKETAKKDKKPTQVQADPEKLPDPAPENQWAKSFKW